VHNLESLSQLGAVLSAPDRRGRSLVPIHQNETIPPRKSRRT
jgi:hypothetical protein